MTSIENRIAAAAWKDTQASLTAGIAQSTRPAEIAVGSRFRVRPAATPPSARRRRTPDSPVGRLPRNYAGRRAIQVAGGFSGR